MARVMDEADTINHVGNRTRVPMTEATLASP